MERQLEGVRQQHRDEDKNVLCPLMQADRLEENFERSGAVVELTSHPDLSRFQLGPEREAGVGHHGLAGMFEQGHVGRRVADVVESLLRETLLEALEFIVPGQIRGAIAGQDFFEDAQMFRDALGQCWLSAPVVRYSLRPSPRCSARYSSSLRL